jgi:hypothetical protein
VVALLLLELTAGRSEPSVDVTPVAGSQHLLANPSAVAAVAKASLVVGRAERLGRPLLGEDRPWDVDWGNAYPNVAFDAAAGKYKLWWGGLAACPNDYAHLEPGCAPVPTAPPYTSCVCPVPTYQWPLWHPAQNITSEWSMQFYAESTDGLNWTRPDLGLLQLPYHGGGSGDVVLWAPGADLNRGVLLDLTCANASERYKMIGSFGHSLGNPRLISSEYGTAVSADGVHWGAARPIVGPGFSGFEGQPVAIKMDSHHNIMWDESRGLYFAYVRVVPPPSCLKDHPNTCLFHRIGVTSSKDFLHWTPPVQILVGDSEATNLTYAMVGWREADTYLGVVMVYSRATGLVGCELAVSAEPDRGWRRVQPGVSLIEHGPPGSFDQSVCFAAAHPLQLPPIVSGGTVAHRLYYAAADGHHSSIRRNKISVATLRHHGFAGFRAASTTGVVTTRAVLCTGAVLTVTADALGGELRVGAIGIVGLAASDNVAAVTSNVTAAPVRFKGTASFVDLLGRNVTLEIRLSSATVYAVGFAAKTDDGSVHTEQGCVH